MYNLINNAIFLKSFLFIMSGQSGSRRVSLPPALSFTMQMVSELTSTRVQLFKKTLFSSMPLLVAYPPIFYPASVSHLSFSAVSISKKLFVLRRPLPLLGRIAAYNQVAGIYTKLLVGNPMKRITENQVIYKYGVGVTTPCDAIIFCLCIGFSMWYAMLPNTLLTMPSYNSYDVLLNPDVMETIRRITSTMSDDIARLFLGVFSDLSMIMSSDGASPVMTSTGINADSQAESCSHFDPLRVTHREMLTKLIFSCLTVSLFVYLSQGELNTLEFDI